MSKIDELIQELCPNGVEYKELGAVEDSGIIKLGRGNVISKTDIVGSPGDYPVYSSSAAGSGEFGRYGKYMFDDERITWSIDGGGRFFYRTAHKYSVTNVSGWLKVIKIDILDIKFLYYVLTDIWKTKAYDYTKKAHPSIIRNEYIIPIPPLPIQQEIVRILDNFTKLEAELEAELEARKKQYEYYRNQLLTPIEIDGKWFMNGKEAEWKKLGDMCAIYDGTHQTPKYTETGVRFVSVENIKALYNSTKCISHAEYDRLYKVKPRVNDVFMTRIGSIGACALVDREDDLAYYVTLTLIRPNPDIINSKYLRFTIESSVGQHELWKRTLVNATPIKINLGDIGKISLPIPPLDEQERIVSILDRFDALVNDITIGLPGEIAARRKQYEYFRGKLLTFKNIAEGQEA